MKPDNETITDLLKHMQGLGILYQEGIIMAYEYNIRALEYINRARKTLGYEPLDNLPDRMKKRAEDWTP